MELLQLRDLYNERVEEAIEPLRKNFLAGLDRLEKDLAERRKLEEALYVRESRTKFALDWKAEVPEDSIERSKEFTRVYGIYVKHREAQVRPLRQKYLVALKAMEASMIADRKLDAAIAVKKEIEMVKVKSAAGIPTFRPMLRGEKPDGDVALSSKGAKAEAEQGAGFLIDGDENPKNMCWGAIPSDFVVTLGKVYVLTKISFLLYNFGFQNLYIHFGVIFKR